MSARRRVPADQLQLLPFCVLLSSIAPGFYDDYPKKGIRFCDILPVLRDPLAFELLITNIVSHIFTHTIPSLDDSSTPPLPNPLPWNQAQNPTATARSTLS